MDNPNDPTRTKRPREDQSDSSNASAILDESKTIIASFVNEQGVSAGPHIDLPISMSPRDLNMILHSILSESTPDYSPVPYSFYIDDLIISTSVFETLVHSDQMRRGIYRNTTSSISTLTVDQKSKRAKKTISMLSEATEGVVVIIYVPQANFRCRSVTHCSATLEGHTEAVLTSQFSPDGAQLATGSGDKTVRIWDLSTQTPYLTLKGHRGWIMDLAWSPDAKKIASGSKDNTVRVWNMNQPFSKITSTCRVLTGHKDLVTSIAWKPFHESHTCEILASASKDGTIIVWNARTGKKTLTVAAHSAPVMKIKWGAFGYLYSCSRDRLIKVWKIEDGKLVNTLKGHAHWVNFLALNTDYVIRTGPFDEYGKRPVSNEDAVKQAKERISKIAPEQKFEKIASCSDDHTIFMWTPCVSTTPVVRMTGHQQPITHISYSPDGQVIASASFDKNIKLWSGTNGKFQVTLVGHVGRVYQVCWSSDSRLLVSGSADSTLKVWDIKTRKIAMDLPGHADAIFTVDWAPDGQSVVSGGKDTRVKIWRS